MKDIDFDELDKAVNTLMAGVSGPSDSKPTITPPADRATPSSGSNVVDPTTETPNVVKPLETPKTPSVSTLPTPPAAKRTGRFMDVVTPSAKKPEATKPKVSRSGMTIEPSQPVMPESPAPAAPATASPAVTPSESPAPQAPPATEPTTTQTDWPDPLDVANFTDKESPSSPAAETDTKEPAKDTVVTQPKAKDQPQEVAPDTLEAEPLVTPFLPDTKVEKRPLGANTTPDTIAKTDLSAEGPKAESSQLTEIDSDDQLPATSEDVKPILPEELHSDLVAIESDTTEPVQPDTPEDSPAEPPKVETPVATKASEPPKPAPSPAVTGPTSIPQQYREEPASGEQKSGAIYDTENYHKPLAHPAKQKSGWMWVVWIVLILIIGAGAGAALYFLGVYKF